MKVSIYFLGVGQDIDGRTVELDYVPIVGDRFSYQDGDYYVCGDVVQRQIDAYIQDGKLVTSANIHVVEF